MFNLDFYNNNSRYNCYRQFWFKCIIKFYFRKRYRHHKGLHYHISQTHPDLKFLQRDNEENNLEKTDDSSPGNISNQDDESNSLEKREKENEFVKQKLTKHKEKPENEASNKTVNNKHNGNNIADLQFQSDNSALPSDIRPELQKFASENIAVKQDLNTVQRFPLGMQPGRFQSPDFPTIGPVMQHSPNIPQAMVLSPRPTMTGNNFGAQQQGLDLSNQVQNQSSKNDSHGKKETADKKSATGSKSKNSPEKSNNGKPQSKNQPNLNANSFTANLNPNKPGAQNPTLEQPWGPPHLLHPAFFMQQGKNIFKFIIKYRFMK